VEWTTATLIVDLTTDGKCCAWSLRGAVNEGPYLQLGQGTSWSWSWIAPSQAASYSTQWIDKLWHLLGGTDPSGSFARSVGPRGLPS